MQAESHYRPYDYRKLQLAPWLVLCDFAEREAFTYSLGITPSWRKFPLEGVILSRYFEKGIF